MKSGKDKGKNKAKAGKKTPASKSPATVISVETVFEKRAARNVDKIRAKLSAAMDDPQMREQIVRAMRDLINEDSK